MAMFPLFPLHLLAVCPPPTYNFTKVGNAKAIWKREEP